ncbi:hypothetical protein PsYK624_156870 [Phanerochaete sordida]|uniref:Polyprotein n=1 Tax=Phanerochaete sordida TaxID=48140 RepID=A0A9P3GPP7_9APHY|nr:hypothetical protein PsYK624_156870 [Phanerochaete sordida]
MSSASTAGGPQASTASASMSAFAKASAVPAIRLEQMEKLKGSSNYQQWSLLMMRYFQATKTWPIINGTLPCPDNASSDRESWEQVDAASCFVLTNVLDPSLLHLVNDPDLTAAAIWKKLCDNYSSTSTMAAFTKFKQYFAHTIDGSQPLEQQLDERGRLWKEVYDSGILQNLELLQVFGIMTALPESYNNVVEPILAVTKPGDLKLDVVRNRLLDEAARKEAPAVAAARFTGKPQAGASSKKKDKKKQKQKKEGDCRYCGKPGHWEAECLTKKANSEALKKTNPGDSKGVSNSGSASVHVVSAADGAAAPEASIHSASWYSSGSTPWMIDSGCTKHITHDLNDFADYTAFSVPSHATLADKAKTRVSTLGSGLVVATTVVDGRTVELRLEGVLYAPSMENRLLSVACIEAKGFEIVFGNRRARITRNGTTYGVGICRGGQYWLSLTAGAVTVAASTHSASLTDRIHARFGHLNWEAIQKLRATDNPPVKGLTFDNSDRSPHPCEGCMMGKQHRRSFQPSTRPRAAHPFDLIHSDLDGPMSVPSVRGGKRYFATFIDDCTDVTWVYTLVTKDELMPKFKELQALIATQFEAKIKVFQSDRGGEYQSNEFIQLSKGFWEEAVMTAVHVRNRAPHRALDWRTPIEVLTGTIPDVSYFRVFGCLAYRHVPKDKRKKLDAHAQPLVFVGYETNSKGYRLWDKHSRRLIASTDVVFDETVFPNRPEAPASTSSKPSGPATSMPEPSPYVTLDAPPLPDASAPTTQPSHSPVPPPSPTTVHPSPPPPSPPSTPSASAPTPSSSTSPADDAPAAPPLRRGTRVRQPPKRFQSHFPAATEQDVDEYLDENHAAAAVDAPVTGEPSTFRQAVSSPDSDEWWAAIKAEIDGLIGEGTWELVDLPDGRKAIKCKWVYKVKHDENGDVERYKARLVAKGFTQVLGLDYEDTFAPVARLESWRYLIALAAILGWEIHQIDFDRAYLNDELDEELYMEQPEGFVEIAGKVCRLRKAIYGLKQAGRQWFLTLRACLEELGFVCRDSGDVSIFVHHRHGGDIEILVVYVDDLTMMGNSLDLITRTKEALKGKFKLKDLGELKHYLGIRITRDRPR